METGQTVIPSEFNKMEKETFTKEQLDRYYGTKMEKDFVGDNPETMKEGTITPKEFKRKREPYKLDLNKEFKLGRGKGEKRSKETKRKMSKSARGNKSAWKGGKIINWRGYVFIYKPNHPFAECKGYVREHRLVMEKHLGRFLKPQEVVHHINGDKANNDISNLKLFSTTGNHTKFHEKLRRELL